MEKILNQINSPDDIKRLDITKLRLLSDEIRKFLIEKVSKTGGHLASNLGVVELSIALHKVFSTPFDKIVWDVGHQSYVHKIITERRELFDTLRQMNGISGFPKTKESKHDSFNTGHSSTSISAALGIARARDILNEKYNVIAVIGDGALTGGMAYEALNDAGHSKNNLIVILNDNEMSISKNVGGMSKYLSQIRTEPFYFKVKGDLDQILNKIPAIGKSAAKALDKVKGSIKYMIMPGVIFEELGFKYIGPIDGHDINVLSQVLSKAKTLKGPILIHILTQKGKGYCHAEENPHVFHGISPFEIETGELLKPGEISYSDVLGEELVKLAQKDDKIVAITAAMPNGTGLESFSKKFKNRFFDVGIAEQHAVTFAAGLASNKIKPVVAIYSSFLQRAYDQVLHDVALQKLHVIFAIDRAGIVGEDGETHQGIYDMSYLRTIPNITILAPCDYTELRQMLKFAVCFDGPVAIRYPRGKGNDCLHDPIEIEYSKGVLLEEGSELTIVSVGSMVENAILLHKALLKNGITSDLINARFVKPLDENLILDSVRKTKKIITIEDNIILGGFGAGIAELLTKNNINAKVNINGFPDIPIEQGKRLELLKKFKLDVESLLEIALKMF